MKNMFFKVFKLWVIFTFLLFFGISFADDLDNDFENINDISIETSNNVSSTLNLNARSCVVIDRQSQTIMYGKNENAKVKMASTTKIMTAMVIIENCNLNQTVEVSKKAALTGGSRLGLKTGDEITIKDLLYGLMLCSGNDAAVALAETLGGSIDGFSQYMNTKALELGLTNTHFESPHGLDSDGHYTTAYELALLTNYALQNSTFMNIVGTKNYTATINGYPKNLNNTNELLGYLDGVYGVKTGFTNGANRCLVTACKRGDMDIISVVLGCDTKKFRTTDSIKLIEYAFNNFEYVNISEVVTQKFNDWKNENQDYFSIYKGANSKLELQFSALENPVIPVLKTSIDSIQVNFNIENYFEAPVFPNTIVGNLTVNCCDGLITNSTIFTANVVPKKSVFDYFNILLKEWQNIDFKKSIL